VIAATYPEAPISVQNVPGLTTSTQIGLAWTEGANNGGTSVTDYQISYALETDDTYTIYSSNIVESTEIITGLSPGSNYKFKIKSRNIIGFSDYSSIVVIKAAQVPDVPTGLVNVPVITAANQIGLQWVAPVFDGGSTLFDYTIYYDNASGNNFEELVVGLTDTTYTATSLTQGESYQFKVEARNQYGFSFFSNTVSILTA
jgi:hypothetical protein